MDMGCVRMTERYFLRATRRPPSRSPRRPPISTRWSTRAARSVDLTGIGTPVGVAGSVTTLTAYALRLPAYQPDAIHLARLDVPTTLATCAEVLAMTSRAARRDPVDAPGPRRRHRSRALVWSGSSGGSPLAAPSPTW